MIQSGYFDKRDCKKGVRALCLLLQNAAKSNLQAVRRKFEKEKFQQVAAIDFRLGKKK